MPQLFLSYANTPEILSVLQNFADCMQQAGITPWWDRTRLIAGRTFAHEIEQQVKASAVVTVLVTPATFSSEWVLRELQIAQMARRLIIPAFLHPSFVPPAFAEILGKLNRLELFRYARADWPRALLWTLHENGFALRWPNGMPFAMPPIASDIDAIDPPYRVLRQMGRDEVATLLQRLAAGIERNAAWGFGHLNLGLVRLHLQDRAGALATFQEALRHLPRVADCYAYLAMAELAFAPLARARTPWLTKAESSLLTARQLRPSDPVFAVFDALITLEHYRANGFRRNAGTDGSHLASDIAAAKADPTRAGELARLAATIPIRNPALRAALADD